MLLMIGKAQSSSIFSPRPARPDERSPLDRTRLAAKRIRHCRWT
jgi:hypothetical protein